MLWSNHACVSSHAVCLPESLLSLDRVGDQHKPNGTTTMNPFEEQQPRIAEYTAQEIATLQSRLDKQLGPEYISSRAGPGGSKVHYLAADKAISLANQVFGFNGWSSSIQNIQIDFVDENPQTGKITLGLSVIVRVTLKDGTHHEDIGYGQIENCKGKAAAFEKAKKEGTTDALKRALRNFGNVLGNCVYDKSYLSKVTKMKVGATKWDENMLYRHQDFAPKKKEEDTKPVSATSTLSVSTHDDSAEFEDTFELADFEEVDFNDVDMGHPDEVALPAESMGIMRKPVIGAPERMHPPPRTEITTPSKPPVLGAPDGRGPDLRPVPPRMAPTPSANNIVPQPLPGQRPQAMPVPTARATGSIDSRPQGTSGPSTKATTVEHPFPDHISRPSSPYQASHNFGPQQPGQSGPAGTGQLNAGFYSAKAAGSIDDNNNIIPTAASNIPKFNPHAESPSIRKTSGVNHNKSVPLKRDLTVDTTPLNVINPQSEQIRRLGAPGPNNQLPAMRGPTTSAYRPPTRRGPELNAGQSNTAAEPSGVDRILQVVKRSPLGDVSNIQHNVTAVTADGADVKRQRVVEPGQNGIEGSARSNQSNG